MEVFPRSTPLKADLVLRAVRDGAESKAIVKHKFAWPEDSLPDSTDRFVRTVVLATSRLGKVLGNYATVYYLHSFHLDRARLAVPHEARCAYVTSFGHPVRLRLLKRTTLGDTARVEDVVALFHGDTLFFDTSGDKCPLLILAQEQPLSDANWSVLVFVSDCSSS